VVPDEVVAYGREVAARLQEVLGDALDGAYYVGSIALGGYVAGESDLDIVAVSERAIPDQEKPSIADAVFDTTMSCPARGLEFTLYRREVAGSSPVDADLESRAEPGFWYVLDRAIAHRCGVVICGPPPVEVFAEVSRTLLLDAMVESMRWHREHEKATLYSVLNASRAWRFAAEDALGSKLEGAAWARERWSSPWVIDAAVDLRYGRSAKLDPAEVDTLLDHVEKALVESK
jgi:predicted nucleotidyltransferase